MDDEQYCLKWNNHQSTLLTVLTGLMDSEKLSDCVMAAEGRMIKAHQVIISACSPFLEKLLNDSRQPGMMPILVFSDVMYEELVAMKEYMYKGEVNIRQDALDSFLKAACALQIKGLADGGGGGSEESGGGGSKRKAQEQSSAPPGRRRRRESRDSDNTTSDMHHDQQISQPAPVKKQNVFTAKIEPYEAAPVVKMEPVMEPAQPQMPQPQIQQHPGQLALKPEPQDHQPEPETHDLTGLDDDEDYDYEMPGTSQPDLSQDISNWQMDNSMHSAEDFAASQSINTSQPQQSSQGLIKKRVHKKSDIKVPCPVCYKLYSSRSTLFRHYKQIHGTSQRCSRSLGSRKKALYLISKQSTSPHKFHKNKSSNKNVRELKLSRTKLFNADLKSPSIKSDGVLNRLKSPKAIVHHDELSPAVSQVTPKSCSRAATVALEFHRQRAEQPPTCAEMTKVNVPSLSQYHKVFDRVMTQVSSGVTINKSSQPVKKVSQPFIANLKQQVTSNNAVNHPSLPEVSLTKVTPKSSKPQPSVLNAVQHHRSGAFMNPNDLIKTIWQCQFCSYSVDDQNQLENHCIIKHGQLPKTM